jgi:hypothetical protein
MASWDFALVEQRFAEAALDPSRWVTALEAVTAATESFGTVLIPNTGGLLPNVPLTEQMEPSADVYFRQGWHLRDERNNGIEIMRKRGVVDDLDISASIALRSIRIIKNFSVRTGYDGSLASRSPARKICGASPFNERSTRSHLRRKRSNS